MDLKSNILQSRMKFPNLGPLCCMPRPKIMRISWTLKGGLQYVLTRGLLKKINKYISDNKKKKEDTKSDEHIVSPCLRQRVEKSLSAF